MHKESLELYRTQEAIWNGYIWLLELEGPGQERLFCCFPVYPSVLKKLRKICKHFFYSKNVIK